LREFGERSRQPDFAQPVGSERIHLLNNSGRAENLACGPRTIFAVADEGNPLSDSFPESSGSPRIEDVQRRLAKRAATRMQYGGGRSHERTALRIEIPVNREINREFRGFQGVEAVLRHSFRSLLHVSR
jgi:hypothetical protein